MSGFTSERTDWGTVERTEHRGEPGVAHWRTRDCGDVRVRMVEYSPGYVADHWCEKGHVLLCLEGELTVELEDGRTFALGPGTGCQLADGDSAHRASTVAGATLFIVD